MIESIASSMLGEETCRNLSRSFDKGEAAYGRLRDQIVLDYKAPISDFGQFYVDDALSIKVGKKFLSCEKGSEIENRIEEYRQSAFAFIHQYLQILETCSSRIKRGLIKESFQEKIERNIQRFSCRFLHGSLDEIRRKIIQIALTRLSRAGVPAEDVFYVGASSEEKVSVGFFQSFENVKLPLFEDVSFAEEEVDEFEDFLLLNLAGEAEEVGTSHEGEEGVLGDYRSYRAITKYKWSVAPHSQYLYFDSEEEESLFFLSTKIQELYREIIGLLGEDVQSYQLIPKGQVWIVRRQEGEISIQEKKVVDEHLKEKMGAHRDHVVAYCFAYKRFRGERFSSLPSFEEYTSVMSKDLAQVKLKISMKKIRKIAEGALKDQGIDEEGYRQFSFANGRLKVFYKNGESTTLSSIEKELRDDERYFCSVYDVYQAIEGKTRNLTL